MSGAPASSSAPLSQRPAESSDPSGLQQALLRMASLTVFVTVLHAANAGVFLLVSASDFSRTPAVGWVFGLVRLVLVGCSLRMVWLLTLVGRAHERSSLRRPAVHARAAEILALVVGQSHWMVSVVGLEHLGSGSPQEVYGAFSFLSGAAWLASRFALLRMVHLHVTAADLGPQQPMRPLWVLFGLDVIFLFTRRWLFLAAPVGWGAGLRLALVISAGMLLVGALNALAARAGGAAPAPRVPDDVEKRARRAARTVWTGAAVMCVGVVMAAAGVGGFVADATMVGAVLLMLVGFISDTERWA